MKLLGLLFLAIGLIILVVGINTWISSLNNGEVIGTFFSLIFGMSMTIGGGALVLIILVLFLIGFLRKNRRVSQ